MPHNEPSSQASSHGKYLATFIVERQNDFVKQEYGNYSTLFTKHRLGDLADLKLFLK